MKRAKHDTARNAAMQNFKRLHRERWKERRYDGVVCLKWVQSDGIFPQKLKKVFYTRLKKNKKK